MVLNHSTASSALLFMLALAKKLPQQERITRAGRWDLQSATMGSEIEGRTLGIVGLGHSGRELARLVAPFGMKLSRLFAACRSEPGRGARRASWSRSTSSLRDGRLRQPARAADADNRGLIGREHFARMKPTAYFINVARGELVDQAALVDALRARRIAGAALDVYEHEPLPLDDPLFELDNVILTPHWSASTTDVFAATGRAMTEGMLRAARGEVPDERRQSRSARPRGLSAKLARFAENRGA